MPIEIAAQVDDELHQAFERLVPQLTNNHPPPARDDLIALLRDQASTLLLARDEQGKIMGALTLAVYHVPTGIRSVIEDVVVDSSARGHGFGEELMNRAIDLAREKGATSISLTSNAQRVAANRLYLKIGFKRRETNVYQLKL